MITINNEKLTIKKNENDDNFTMVIHKDIIKSELNGKLSDKDIDSAMEMIEHSNDISSLMLSIMTGSKCENCKINCHDTGCTARCIPYGNISSDVMFINKMPTSLEHQTTRSHSDTLGIFLSLILSKLGYKREQLYFTDLVKCYDKDMDDESCWQCIVSYVIKEIHLIMPKIIVCESMSVLKFLKESKIFEGLPETNQLQYGRIYEVNFLNDKHPMKIAATYALDKVLEKTGEEYSNVKEKLWQQLVAVKQCIK